MVDADDLITPDGELEIVADGQTVRTTIREADDIFPDGEIPKDCKLAAVVELDESAYVYLLQIDASRDVAVLFPVDGKSVRLEKGTRLRLPIGGGYFNLPLTGSVRFVESPEPVSADEWPKLIAGRDPPPQPSTIDNSAKGSASGSEANASGQKQDESANSKPVLQTRPQ
jgi:hypothetical protein